MKIILQDSFGSRINKEYLKHKWVMYSETFIIKIKRLFGWKYPCETYGMDKLVKEILEYREDYDSYYPEHKPVGLKLKEQTGYLKRINMSEEEYIKMLIWDENRYLFKHKHYKKRHGDNWVFKFYYEGIDFVVTENYCWTTDKKDAYHDSGEWEKDMAAFVDHIFESASKINMDALTPAELEELRRL